VADINEKRRYWNLKEEAVDRALWRTSCRRGYGLVLRQTTWSLDITRPSTIFYRLLLNWASLRRH
jgi:hypothetical protein